MKLVIRAILGFALSRRAIVLFGLLVFIGGGLIAYYKLNIEAYPNPAPVILEITAQAPGLSAEEMERYYTTPDGDRALPHARHRQYPLDLVLWLAFVRVTFKYGVDYYFAYTQARAQPAAERHAPGQSGSRRSSSRASSGRCIATRWSGRRISG